eukprot:Sspe_Gene.118684::Locus_112711_Transcript_1_1_Confidence_1.000_Length_2083::g.118684::m.118684
MVHSTLLLLAQRSKLLDELRAGAQLRRPVDDRLPAVLLKLLPVLQVLELRIVPTADRKEQSRGESELCDVDDLFGLRVDAVQLLEDLRTLLRSLRPEHSINDPRVGEHVVPPRALEHFENVPESLGLKKPAHPRRLGTPLTVAGEGEPPDLLQVFECRRQPCLAPPFRTRVSALRCSAAGKVLLVFLHELHSSLVVHVYGEVVNEGQPHTVAERGVRLDELLHLEDVLLVHQPLHQVFAHTVEPVELLFICRRAQGKGEVRVGVDVPLPVGLLRCRCHGVDKLRRILSKHIVRLHVFLVLLRLPPPAFGFFGDLLHDTRQLLPTELLPDGVLLLEDVLVATDTELVELHPEGVVEQGAVRERLEQGCIEVSVAITQNQDQPCRPGGRSEAVLTDKILDAVYNLAGQLLGQPRAHGDYDGNHLQGEEDVGDALRDFIQVRDDLLLAHKAGSDGVVRIPHLE